MKILQICSIYYGNSLFRRMFEAMERQGMRSVVYVPKWTPDTPKEEVYMVSRRHSKLEKFLFWGEQRYILKDIEARIPLKTIDFVYAHRLLYGGHAALHLYKKYHIPYIVEICNSDIYGLGRNIARFRRHSMEIMQNAERILFFSKPYMDLVLNKYVDGKIRAEIRKKCEVLVCGIDQYFIDHTLPIGSHHIPKEKEINMISIGWIDKNKNLPTVIKACKILIDRGYNVHLKLLGKVIDEKILRTATRLDFIEYLGFRPKEEVVCLLRQADVFVLPSIHESFGLVYAEAMTQGTPIIYTRGQGFDGQYAEGEVGYSVDSLKADEIADRIIDIMSNYREISDRCIQNSKRYDWKTIVQHYAEIFGNTK